MFTCHHCHHPVSETDAERDQLEANVDEEECDCLPAECGHWLSVEMDDTMPCEGCNLCAQCCACLCEHCGQALRAAFHCLGCGQY